MIRVTRVQWVSIRRGSEHPETTKYSDKRMVPKIAWTRVFSRITRKMASYEPTNTPFTHRDQLITELAELHNRERVNHLLIHVLVFSRCDLLNRVNLFDVSI